jgi:uncharacterized protein (DUF302 family)
MRYGFACDKPYIAWPAPVSHCGERGASREVVTCGTRFCVRRQAWFRKEVPMMKYLALAIPLLFVQPAQAELLRKESPYPVAETIDRLEAVAKERGLTIFARIDHAAGAKTVGKELRPTLLLVFGSPAVGTPLIEAEQTMGLSLPLKALAWQDASGKVWLAYDAPAGIAAERGVSKDHPVVGRMTQALNALTDVAVKK